MQPSSDEPTRLNVVTRVDDETVSLLVDDIGDVLELDEENFEPSPDNLTGKVRHFIRGAYKLEDRLLLVLNLEKTIGIAAT